jgi:hypothetical protein
LTKGAPPLGGTAVGAATAGFWVCDQQAAKKTQLKKPATKREAGLMGMGVDMVVVPIE